MLTAVFLHGHLGEKYGAKLMLDVECVAGAIALLKANFADFARDMIGHGNRYRIWVGRANIGRGELHNPAHGQDIHIVPFVAGAGGNSNVINIILGIVLIVVDFFTDYASGGLLTNTGIGMIVGGVAGLIFAPRKLSIAGLNVGEKKASRYFNGPINVTAQGNPVPVLYGRLVVGSQVISGGLSADDF